MAKKLIVSALSTLEAPSALPTQTPQFSVSPNQNMMESSKEKAPVLLSIPSGGTIGGDEFVKKFVEACDNVDASEAARRVNAFGELLAQLAAEGQNFQLGFANFEIAISGSTSAGDEEATPANVPFYAVTMADAVRKTFAAIDTKIDGSACPADVNRVRDVESGEGAIIGTKTFHTQGVMMTYGKSGEKLEILTADAKKKLRDVAVDTETSSLISLTCHLENQLPTGKYFLQLTTLAGGEKTLYPVGINVNCVFVPVEMDEGLKVKVKVGGEGEDTVGIYGGALAEGSTLVTIDWGDGYVEEVTSLSQLSHKYELPGEYTLRISDDVSEIAFSSPIASSPFASEYAKRILEVEGVGEKLKTLRASALSNAANLVNAKFASVDNVLTDVLKGANAIHYIHFAAANETALKASAGYQADTRLGSTSARVKFDL